MRGLVLVAVDRPPEPVRNRIIETLAAAEISPIATVDADTLRRELADGAPTLVVDEDALVDTELVRHLLHAPGESRAVVIRPRGVAGDVSVIDGTIQTKGPLNGRFAGLVVVGAAAAPSVLVHSVRDLVDSIDVVAAVDGRDFDPARFDPMLPVDVQLDAIPDSRRGVRLRRRATVKNDDNLWTTVAVSPWSQFVAAGAARLGLSPNVVTIASMIVALAAASAFATGERAGVVGGAIGVQLAFGLDCADGQLARLTGRYTRLGAWLDWLSDRIKEVVLLVGVVVGSGDAAVLGAAAIALSVVRAQMNQSFEDHRPDASPIPPGSLGAVSLGRRFKNLLTFPYGDRMGMITIVAIVGGLRWVLVVWTGWNAVAFTYQLVGRLRLPTGSSSTRAGLVDDGPVARRLRSWLRSPPSAVALTVAGAAAAAAAWAEPPEVAVVLGTAVLVVMADLRDRQWLSPVLTVGVEFSVLLATMAAVESTAGRWSVLVAVAAVAVQRMVASTGARFAFSVHIGVGWEGRVLLTTFAALVDPIVVLVVAALATTEAAAMAGRQFRSVTQR